MNATEKYPQAIFETNDNWGDDNWFANEETMSDVIENNLKHLGEDWENISIDDCAEWAFVEETENGAVYELRHTRNDVKIILKAASEIGFYDLIRRL